MNIERLITEAYGPDGVDPFEEPMFLARFAALVRAQALEEAEHLCRQGAAAIQACALSVGAVASAKQSPRMLAMLDCAEGIRAINKPPY